MKKQSVVLVDDQLKQISKPVLATRMQYETRNTVVRYPVNGLSQNLQGSDQVEFQISCSAQTMASNPNLLATLEFKVTKTEIAKAPKTYQDQLEELKNVLGVGQFPLNSALSSARVSINGQAGIETSMRTSNIVYKQLLDGDTAVAVSPNSMKDMLSEYDPTLLTNPLRSPLDTPFVGSRGLGTSQVGITRVDDNNILVSIQLREALLARPFQAFSQNKTVLENVSSLHVSLSLQPDFTRLVAVVPSATTTVSNIVLKNMKFEYEDIRPSPLLQKRPSKVYYNTPRFTDYVTAQNNVAPGNTVRDVVIPSWSAQTVPKLYMICVLDEKTSPTKPDVFCRIDSVNLNIAGQPNVFQNLTPQELHAITQRNVGNYALSHFLSQNQKDNLSYFVFTPSDLTLTNTRFQSNMMFPHEMSVSVTYTNHTDGIVAPTVHCIAVNDMYLEIDEQGNVREEMASISWDDLNIENQEYAELSFQQDNVLGGSFWSSLKKGLKKGVDFVKNNKSTVRAVRKAVVEPAIASLPPQYRAAAQTVNQLVDNAGYGYNMVQRKKPGRPKGSKNRGSGIIDLGGKGLTDAQMKKLLSQ